MYIVRPTEVNLWYCSSRWETSGRGLLLVSLLLMKASSPANAKKNQAAPSPQVLCSPTKPQWAVPHLPRRLRFLSAWVHRGLGDVGAPQRTQQ